MTATAEIRNGICLVTLAGEFDRANVGEIEAEIEVCLQQARSIVFDFKDLTFANGAVISLLHDALERLGDGGQVAVAEALPLIEMLFRVAGLTDLPNFRLYPNVSEAFRTMDRE